MTHEGVIDADTWLKNNQKLAANKQIRNAVSTKTSWLDAKYAINLSKKWKTASFEEKRGVCSILVNRIIIDADGNAEIVWNI